jgi:hypothetical protein
VLLTVREAGSHMTYDIYRIIGERMHAVFVHVFIHRVPLVPC